MANLDELRTLAQQIKNETNAGANTANRVGTTFEKTVTELENIEEKVTDLSGVVSRSGVPISSASLEDRIASINAADKKHHSIRFGRVTDDAITVVGYGITGSIMGTYLDVLWSTAKHRFVAYDSSSDKYYSEWAGPHVPSSSDYTSVSSSRPEELSTPYYDKVYIDNAGGVYAYSPSERSLVTADIDLSYLTGVSGIEMSSGGTLDMGLGSITKVDSLVMSGAGSGSISNVKHLTMHTGGELNMSGGTISGMSRIDMSSGTISGVSRIDMNGGTLDMGPGTIIVSGTGAAQLEHINGVQEIFGKNTVHISMSGSTTGDGIDFGNAPLKNINGITMYSGGKITGADLAGNGNNISGYSNITMRSSGYLEMIGGTLNVIGGVINASGATINGAYLSGVYIRGGYLYDNTQMESVDISGSINAPYQTLTINRITGVSGGINMDGGSISGASSISGAGGAVNIGFSGAGISGKLDMISGILETSGVTLKSGGVLTFGDGTTMNTAATPTNLDDANNVIGGKELKIYYGTGGTSMSPFSYMSGSTQLNIGRIFTDDITSTNFSSDSIIGHTISGTLISGTLQGTIQGTTFSSGNTFTSGFIYELKAALGIS